MLTSSNRCSQVRNLFFGGIATKYDLLDGLQTTASEATMPKLATSKRKGKKGPRQRQARITNTHLKLDIDLSKDYVPGS